MRRDDRDPPERLRLVLAFVNTLDVEDVSDALASPTALAAWCREHAGAPADLQATRRDLGAAIEVRDALRTALLANSGIAVRPDDLAAQNERLARYHAGFALDAEGRPVAVPSGRGVGAMLARLLVDVAVAHVEGQWERAKLCPAEDCLWAFYDHSKNRSRRWCSMDLCGNRTKTRTYRQRHR